jgi:hypothetical protein
VSTESGAAAAEATNVTAGKPAPVAAAEASMATSKPTGVTTTAMASSALRPDGHRQEKRERSDGNQATHHKAIITPKRKPGAACPKVQIVDPNFAASSRSPALSESVTKLDAERRRWEKLDASREAAAQESPPRKWREGESGKNRVRFSGRHKFRNRL